MKKWMKKVAISALSLSVLPFANLVGVQEVSAQDPVEIEFWYGLGSEAGQKMESIIQSFNESQAEVVVTGVAQASYTETEQNIQAAMAAGTVPGAFIAGPSTTHRLATAGHIQDLTEIAAANENFVEENFLEAFMDLSKVSEGLYAIPAYGTTQVMYYNQNVYEEAGVDPAEAFASWENLAAASKTIQETTDASFGHLPMWGPGNLADIAYSNGGSMLSEDGTQVMINSPEWVEAWEFIRVQLHDEQTMGINSGGQGWEYWYATIDQMLQGIGGGYTGSSGDKGNIDFSYIGSFPQPGLNGNPGAASAEVLQMVVPAQASPEEQAAAFKFMMYFTSPEISADWSMAIGYIPVNQAVMENETYAAFIKENPHAAVPYEQALAGTAQFIDPTGGAISDALSIAADKVELQNVPAKEALDEAAAVAQEALDKVLSE